MEEQLTQQKDDTVYSNNSETVNYYAVSKPAKTGTIGKMAVLQKQC